MKVPTRTKTQEIEDKISFIERTIKKLGVCTIRNEKLTGTDVSKLRERFTLEQSMGYTKFSKR